MIKTEYRFATALKTLMAEVPLDNISVTLLAKKCQVKRQTFYYHFHDIYDLLTLVFLNETIEGINEAKTIKQIIKYIYDYYSKNKPFVEATIDSAAKDLFQEFIYNNSYKSLLKIINNEPESKKIHPNDKKSIARYYAMAFSSSIVYYLSNYKNKTLDGFMLSVCFENETSLKNAIERFAHVRNKK